MRFKFGVPRAEVVHHQLDAAARAELAQDVDAQLVVGEGNGLGDLEVHVVIVRVERIVRTDEPGLLELLRVHVQK